MEMPKKGELVMCRPPFVGFPFMGQVIAVNKRLERVLLVTGIKGEKGNIVHTVSFGRLFRRVQ